VVPDDGVGEPPVELDVWLPEELEESPEVCPLPLLPEMGHAMVMERGESFGTEEQLEQS